MWWVTGHTIFKKNKQKWNTTLAFDEDRNTLEVPNKVNKKSNDKELGTHQWWEIDCERLTMSRLLKRLEFQERMDTSRMVKRRIQERLDKRWVRITTGNKRNREEHVVRPLRGVIIGTINITNGTKKRKIVLSNRTDNMSETFNNKLYKTDRIINQYGLPIQTRNTIPNRNAGVGLE